MYDNSLFVFCFDGQGATLNGFLQSGKLTNIEDLDYIYTKAKNL